MKATDALDFRRKPRMLTLASGKVLAKKKEKNLSM
jgi:hypothetical protein